MKLKLSNGHSYGFDSTGRRVCIGARMGRPNKLPDDREIGVKLHLEKLKWVDGDYDQEGAYWGYTPGTDIWCAWFAHREGENTIEVFARADRREVAKRIVLEYLPYATFYR